VHETDETDDDTCGRQRIDDGDQQRVFLGACGGGKEGEKGTLELT
jgi:hypothetical protein